MRILRFTLLFACFTFESSLWAASQTKPNIIVFYTDDHGHADLGVHGVVADVKTPNLDTLAGSGVVARHGYSTAPQCVPSRAGLLVGKFQGRFNLDNNRSPLHGFNKETTIATRLQKAGYVTAQFGKWHLGPLPDIPTHGFRHVYAQHSQGRFAANIGLDGRDRSMSEVLPQMYHIDGCSRAAAAMIERYAGQPFFFYVAYRAPHTPLDAPERYLARFPGEMPERRRAALAMLAAVDDGVGLITATLKKHALTERTLIFFIGDNGAPLKIHKIDSPLDGDAGGWDGSLNTPLNGEKGMLAEGGISTPFLIAWPGTIPGGQVYDQPVSALDVAATAAAISGVEVKTGDLDGVNLIPPLTGESKAPPHETLYWRWSAQSAVRQGNWKLLRGGEREYLYDLATDREEKHNLAGKHPEIASRLRDQLKAWSGELDPPGLNFAPMTEVWNVYFDHYLDGKEVTPQAAKAVESGGGKAASATGGWLARNGTLTVKDGVFELIPKGKRAFITLNQLQLPSPAAVKLTFKTATSGVAAVAWRLEKEKDFLPANRVTFDVTGSGDWQTREINLPAAGAIVHVRIYVPEGICLIREIDFSP